MEPAPPHDPQSSEWHEPAPVRRPRNRLLRATIAAVLVVPVGWAASASGSGDGPVDVVRKFFVAVARKDVANALALVDPSGTGVPYGEEAVFLTPAAIADGWGLISATLDRRVDNYRYDEQELATVTATLAGPDGTADGELLVLRDRDGRWRMLSPFVRVEFAPSPLTFMQVNGMVDTFPELSVMPEARWLFPGLYRFYSRLPDGVEMTEMEPVMAFPDYEGLDSHTSVEPYPVAPGGLSVTGPALQAIEDNVASYLEDCAAFSTPEPYNCPFATDGVIDTPDGQRVRAPGELDWEIARYPELELVDHRPEREIPGLRLEQLTPGAVTLTGSGTTTEDERVDFAVECGIEFGDQRITIGPDGEILRFRWTGIFAHLPDNTCYRDT